MGGQTGRGPGAYGFSKQVESCFLNHNSSIHFCCTDSLFMTRRGGLSLSIIIWRIGRGGSSLLLPWGPKLLLAALHIPHTLKKGIETMLKLRKGCTFNMESTNV